MKLYLEAHMDESWRLTDDAADNWMGIICEQGSCDEVLDLTSLVAQDWNRAKRAAEALVKAWNEKD